MLTSIRGVLAATALTGALIAATPAFADETDPPKDVTITGNVAFVTDYRFRGISLSGGDMAVQGAINVNHSSGFYVGAWGSNLEPALGYGSVEIDVYAGWTGAITPGLTADVGVLYYVYPNAGVGSTLNVFEPYASLSTTIGPVSAKVGAAYAPKQDSLDVLDLDGDGEGEDNLYVYTDVGVAIPSTPLTLNGHVGYTSGALSPKLLTGVSFDGGWDYSVGATANVTKNLSVGVSYVGVDGASFNGFSDDAVVGTVKLSF